MSRYVIDLAATRSALQRIATHVVARRRHDVTGRFGLRPAPGGLATPAFGGPDDVEVVRVAGHLLVHERAGRLTAEPISTLAAAAELVGVDLSADFGVGDDTPPLGEIDAPLAIDAGHVRALGAWWSLGAEAVDELVGTSSAISEATVVQLWPEHFDIGATVTVAGEQLNLGASPGDDAIAEPYLYVGPWTDVRPGDPTYWNAPFGAVLRAADCDGRAAAVQFLQQGVERFAH